MLNSAEVIKLFPCLTQLSMKCSILINMKMPTFSYLLAEKYSCSAMLVLGKKEVAIDSDLRFISRRNFTLTGVEHEKSFITSRPSLQFDGLSVL